MYNVGGNFGPPFPGLEIRYASENYSQNGIFKIQNHIFP